MFKITKPYRNRRPGPITALEIDGSVLRLVQSSPRGNRTEITHLAVARLEMPVEGQRSDPSVLGSAIAKALQELRVKPSSVVMGVPRAVVVLRTLVLPRTEDLRELASMVHFQIGKDLPFRVEEAVIDFTVHRNVSLASTEPNGKANVSAEKRSEPPVAAEKMEVLVASVKREVVAYYEKVAAAAGVKLVALGWLSYANARCVEACHVAEGDEGIALISLRPDEVGIDIMARGSLLFSRGATIHLPSSTADSAPDPGSPGIDKPEPAPPLEPNGTATPQNFIEAVTIEVVRSLHSYGGMKAFIPVAKVAVAGATGEEASVVAALQTRLDIPCRLLDPASALNLTASQREHASGSVSALGLALGVSDSESLPFDFLNPKRPAVQRNTRRIKIMAAAAAGAILLFGLLGVRSHFIKERLKIQRALQAELTDAEKKRPIYRQMRQQAVTVHDWLKENRDCLEQYAYLSAILPASEELYITSLSVSSQGSIRLAVQARSGQTLAKLDKQLRAAGYEVKPLAVTPGADKFGYNFRSTVELLAPDKLKIDLSTLRPPPRPADDASLNPAQRAHRKGGRS